MFLIIARINSTHIQSTHNWWFILQVWLWLIKQYKELHAVIIPLDVVILVLSISDRGIICDEWPRQWVYKGVRPPGAILHLHFYITPHKYTLHDVFYRGFNNLHVKITHTFLSYCVWIHSVYIVFLIPGISTLRLFKNKKTYRKYTNCMCTCKSNVAPCNYQIQKWIPQ